VTVDVGAWECFCSPYMQLQDPVTDLLFQASSSNHWALIGLVQPASIALSFGIVTLFQQCSGCAHQRLDPSINVSRINNCSNPIIYTQMGRDCIKPINQSISQCGSTRAVRSNSTALITLPSLQAGAIKQNFGEAPTAVLSTPSH